MEKLENFIEKYLKTKKKTDYEGWLALYGTDGEQTYRKDKKEAETTYAKSLAEHGRRASRLNEAGLSSGGYSDYLNHTAYAARTEELSRAKDRRDQTSLANQKGYAEFLAALAEEEDREAKEQTEYEQKLFNTLISKGITDEQAGLTYLTNAGLSLSRAQELASRAVTVQRGSTSLQNRLISEATDAYMDHYTAYKYAITHGVSEDVAQMIADAVDIAVQKKKSYLYRYYY